MKNLSRTDKAILGLSAFIAATAITLFAVSPVFRAVFFALPV